MELTPDQVLIVGVVASILVVVLNFIAANFGYKLGKGTLTIVVAVVSGLLAVLFNLPKLPVYVDPLQYVGEWLALLSAYVGIATLVYNLIIDKVLQRLNLTQERFLKK
jgi:hypothetical protein